MGTKIKAQMRIYSDFAKGIIPSVHKDILRSGRVFMLEMAVKELKEKLALYKELEEAATEIEHMLRNLGSNIYEWKKELYALSSILKRIKEASNG